MYSKKTPQAPPISRGGACNNCKRRKMFSLPLLMSNCLPPSTPPRPSRRASQRCDGQRPICGPCSKSTSLGDCEYAEAGYTHADRLQEQISVLETRLEQLQSGPSSSNQALALHDPYAPRSSGMYGYSMMLTEKDLMEAILPHLSQLGFFLNSSNLFSDAYSNPTAIDPAYQPSSALTASMVLLGAHVSHHFNRNSNITSEIVEGYLSNAVQATSFGLSEPHPHRILHTIQANILIAHYFFLNNRALKGRWHVDNAVSLVLSARLHLIRSGSTSRSAGLPSTSTSQRGFATQNAQIWEEGEQINAMWTVFGLNCLWSAAEGIPVSIAYTTDQGRIDTPWPLESGGYNEVTLPPGLRSSHTVQRFLSGFRDQANSLLALYVKGAVLYEQTTMFRQRYVTDGTNTPSTTSYNNAAEFQTFQSSYLSLSNLSTELLNDIPPITPRSQFNQQDRILRLLVIHILVRVTIIRLQSTLWVDHPLRRPVLLDMANGVMDCLSRVDLDVTMFLDPIIAILLRTTAEVFIETIRESSSRASYSNSAEVQNSSSHLNQIRIVMARFSDVVPLMASKLLEIGA
ncbi:hypothetical protein EV360DRAFT_68706 [Lentinula raphanica]|nr:hypothetical protein EV360DRAFT_68706 [Lentinula raphanica]